jgi:type IV pilus assembly protein PilW
MKKHARGFSLIELLVSIVISMVAMIAVIEIYSAAQQTSRVQRMQSRLTEDGRFATAMMQRVVYQAGYRQLPSTDPYSDAFVNAANQMTVKFDADGSNQIACDGSVPGAGTTQTLVIKKTDSKLQCGTVDWIAPTAGAGTGNGNEVVDFGVKFGIDTGPAATSEDVGCGTASAGTKPRDCIVDSYVDALTGTQTTAQIVAVKVCLVLRSEMVDSSVVKPAAVKNCAGDNIASSQDDHKLYRAFRTTIVLKNR